MSFFPILYDNFISNDDFANSLFDSSTYNGVGMIMVISSIVGMPIYYYIISNYGKLYKISAWAIWILIIALINFFVANYNARLMLNTIFPDSDHNFTFLDIITFPITNFIWSIVFCFILSIPLKLKSIQASKTPF